MANELQRCLAALRRGERQVLAQTLSRVESTRQEDRDFIVALLRSAAQEQPETVRLGITGAAGAGKSTLIDVFGLHLLPRQRGPLAVLAIDPASPRSKGSILGDKLRMGKLAGHEQVFVRPLAGRQAAGGVHVLLPEMVRLCELAGYRTIIVETMGSGQSDYAVRHSVDVVVTLLSGGGGDMVQGLKKGLNEMSDVFVVTKHDGNTRLLAEQAHTALQQALRLRDGKTHAEILLTSAVEDRGVEALCVSIDKLLTARTTSGALQRHRVEQAVAFFKTELARVCQDRMFTQHAELLTQMSERITTEGLPPSVAVRLVAEHLGW